MNDDDAKPDNTGERQDRRWRKGQSGNPAGCKKGSRHKASLLAEPLMESDAEDVIRAVIDRAKGGDMVAARIIVERILPPMKSRPVSFALPAISSAADASAALGALLQSVSTGEMAPDEAANVAALIEAFRKAHETVDLEARIQRLEAAWGVTP